VISFVAHHLLHLIITFYASIFVTAFNLEKTVWSLEAILLQYKINNIMTKLAAIVPALFALGSSAPVSVSSDAAARARLISDLGDRRSIGFGVQRLQRHKKGKLQQDACAGIQELRFKDAVLDNFAPVFTLAHLIA
jgi:hypothetical protein